MLMFVFGAGASFDSDPKRLPGDDDVAWSEEACRPPLAPGLVDPASIEGESIVADFPRAAPLLMQVRQAVAEGRDIEEFLEELALGADSYPPLTAQLLSFRAYLSRLLARVPAEWAQNAQGLTNYVLALDAANRWNIESHAGDRGPVMCVNFNYDLLVEQAIRKVFGRAVGGLDDYTSSADVRLYKPHGSVSWRQAADWVQPDARWLDGDLALDHAIAQAASLTWRNEWAMVDDPAAPEAYQDGNDRSVVWLPALSIPIRRKADFTMPVEHREALVEDLGKVTTVIAIGWRAREQHFLRLIQDALPSKPCRLVAVAENNGAALDTIDSLWQTGRFSSYAVCGTGFSGFTRLSAEPPAILDPTDDPYRSHTGLTLRHVLTSDDAGHTWTTRPPGVGLPAAEVVTPPGPRAYADL